MHDCLEGLSEDEARMNLVPSKTTLLGLVKHVTFVEGVWFDQAVTGHTYEEIGIATTPERSFILRKADTISSVQTEYRRRSDRSRRTMAALAPDDVVEGREGGSCGHSTSRCCESSPNTPATPTF